MERERWYEVTVTNITGGQIFTPILVLTHRHGVKLFTPGMPASLELAKLAEAGDTGPLSERMSMNPKVGEIITSGGLLGPGEEKTIMVPAGGPYKYISLAAMMLPTNDGFIALNGVRAPRGHRTVMYLSPGYDAGSEINDELCENIPGGGGCGGVPFSEEDGEKYVHIHGGIHGIGDLAAADYDWKNPVARIVIERVTEHEEHR